MCKVLQAALIRHCDGSLASQWLHTHKDIGRAFALILGVNSAHLPHDCRIVGVGLQSGAVVDDVNCRTSDNGLIFAQVKRSV